MEIELNKPAQTDAVASLKRYFEENLSEPIGDLTASLLLDFILQEIGPAVYNLAIADAQARLQQRVADLTSELYAVEFPYWPRQQPRRRR
ncbi:MAG: DUF2164 domain-containing protein [Acidobacteria bacterium]|nr:DUF2164 domain-containing protein [Acidobacteriota bacterium]